MDIPALVRFWGETRPDHEAIVFRDRVQTWREVDEATDALARGLIARGIAPGDRVGLLMRNRLELAHLILAVLKAGGVCVPLNFRLVSAELTDLLVDAAPRLVVTEGDFAPSVEDARRALGFDLVTTDHAELPAYDGLLVAEGEAPVVPIAEDAPAFLCYTSGTTGVQKGAVLTHRNVIAGAQAQVVANGITYRDRVLAPAPLVYTGSVISVFLQFVVYPGATMVLLGDFDPSEALAVMERHRVTVATFVPVIWQRIAEQPDFATRDLAPFTYAAAGGAPVPLETLQRYRDRGVPLCQVYGLTEASGMVATLPLREALECPDFAGRALLGTEVRIAAEDGSTAAPGEVGEVLVRGPHVMKEYWNNPDATAAALRDGWLHTGDLGLKDERGLLKIVDRAKDMVISGGLNVYPAEIEKALAAADGVTDLAVIGVPDDRWGEVPMVVFYSARQADDVVRDLAEAARARLAKFKWPRYAVASPEPLPRTFSGKLAKVALRDRYPKPPADALDLIPATPQHGE